MTGKEKNIREAIDCISTFPGSDDYSVQPGMVQKYNRRIFAIIDENLGLDPHEHRMSKEAMRSVVNELLHDVAKDLDNDPGADLQEEFERSKDRVLSDALGQSKSLFTFAFPLNLTWHDEYPSSLCVSGANIEHISREEWTSNFLEPALTADETSLERFLNEESPNDLSRTPSYRHRFTFWKTECEARDQLYALSVVQDTMQLFLAELNYVLFRGSAGKPRVPSHSSSPPNARWSRLQAPFFYLIFDNIGEFSQHWITDYGYRRKPPNMPMNSVDRIRSIREFPDLSVEYNSMHGTTAIFVSGLLAFQNGITASSPQDSFFNFWRGLEWLSRAQGEELLERSRGAFESDLLDYRFTPEQRDAFEELREKRNSWAHEGIGVRISEQHQSVAKMLLDSLIELYMHLWQEGRGDEYFSEFLKYLSYSEERREHIDSMLSDVRSLV